MSEQTPQPTGVSTVGFIFGVCQARALPRPVLTELLGHVGMSESASRHLLDRMSDEGQLTHDIHGRVSVYRMAGTMLARFHTLRLTRNDPPWEGHFHVVVHELLEQEPRWRDRLHATGLGAGFASLRPGVLIGVDSPQRWVRQFTLLREQLGLIETGTWEVSLQAARRVTTLAWDIENRSREIAATVEAIETTTHAPDGDGWDALRRLRDAASRGATIWLSTPRLPAELLPQDWPLPALSRAVDRVIAETTPRVDETVQAYLSGHRHAALIEHSRPHDWGVP